MKRIAVIGHTGVVGSAIVRRAQRDGADVTGFSRSTGFDLAAPATDALDRSRPAIVFLAAALTNVDYCELHADESRRINVDGPAAIAEWCAARDIPLVFFSSDYVFDGADGPYDESRSPRPLNVYGRQKLAAEEAIAGVGAESLIVRTTGVFGAEQARKNFVLSLIDRLSRGENVQVPRDQIGTPTWADDLADAVMTVLRSESRGIMHITGASRMSRFEFARRIAAHFGLDEKRIIGVDTASLGQPAPRPLSAGLISNRLGRALMTVDEALGAFASS